MSGCKLFSGGSPRLRHALFRLCRGKDEREDGLHHAAVTLLRRNPGEGDIFGKANQIAKTESQVTRMLPAGLLRDLAE